MERITKAHIYAEFIRLCNALGKAVCISEGDMKRFAKQNQYFPRPDKAASYRDIGAWHLDYASCYGGWVIVEADNEQGGISHPIGSCRHSNSEFFRMINTARNMLGYIAYEKQQGRM